MGRSDFEFSRGFTRHLAPKLCFRANNTASYAGYRIPTTVPLQDSSKALKTCSLRGRGRYLLMLVACRCCPNWSSTNIIALWGHASKEVNRKDIVTLLNLSLATQWTQICAGFLLTRVRISLFHPWSSPFPSWVRVFNIIQRIWYLLFLWLWDLLSWLALLLGWLWLLMNVLDTPERCDTKIYLLLHCAMTKYKRTSISNWYTTFLEILNAEL